MKFKQYDKTEKGTFHYWFEHVKAYNWVAWKYKVWKPKYLFHDFEKPWLKLILGDYDKVRKYHKAHSRHHLGYHGYRERDWDAMILDWECSRYTKLNNPLDAIETIDWMYRCGRVNIPEVKKLVRAYRKMRYYDTNPICFCIGVSEKEIEVISGVPYFKCPDKKEVTNYFLTVTISDNKFNIEILDKPRGSIILAENVFHEFFLK